jgi:HD-like signal output (HDOD) protein
MDAIDRLVAQIECLPTLPQVAAASLAELEREECDFEEIASLIALDPVLAGRVLRLANSAFFGAGKRADTVLAAISRLGLREVRRCLLTVAVMQAIPELPHPHSAKRFWTLSLASALLAQELAQQLAPREAQKSGTAADHAYSAGLAHLVGDAVLAVQFTERYRRAIEIARTDAMPLASALSEEFGCDSAALAARVLREWRFAEPVVLAVQRQFAPQHAGPHALLASCVLVADGLCRELGGLGLPGLDGPARGWLPKLAASFTDAVHARSGGGVPEYLDALAERVHECVDFALTVF